MTSFLHNLFIYPFTISINWGFKILFELLEIRSHKSVDMNMWLRSVFFS